MSVTGSKIEVAEKRTMPVTGSEIEEANEAADEQKQRESRGKFVMSSARGKKQERGPIRSEVTRKQRIQGALLLGAGAVATLCLCGAAVMAPTIIEPIKESFNTLSPLAQSGIRSAGMALVGGIIGATRSKDKTITGRAAGFAEGALKGGATGIAFEVGAKVVDIYQSVSEGGQLLMRGAGRALIGALSGNALTQDPDNRGRNIGIGAAAAVGVPPIVGAFL